MVREMDDALVRPALMGDVKRIKTLVNGSAGDGKLLPSSFSELYSSVRDFMVVEKAGEVVAACALQLCWEGLAEIRSLVVDERFQGRGYARKLLGGQVREAKRLGVKRVFALTYLTDMFRKFGFAPIDKSELPHKIWVDCVKCSRFPDCDETAVAMEIKQ